MTGPTPTTPQYQSKWANQPSRHERGYGSAWVKLRLTILKRDGYLCQQCLSQGRPTPATEVDHRIGKAKGGTDDADNLQAICSPCHKAKTITENGGTITKTTGLDGWPIE